MMTKKTKPQNRTHRKAINVHVSDDAHAAWQEFSMDQGASVSALIEVIGPNLMGIMPKSLVKEARRVDGERARRPRKEQAA